MARRKLSQAQKDNLPKQKYMKCGNKLKGWNDLGVNCFNELMDEVEEDQESNDSRKSEKEFQWAASSSTVLTREKEEEGSGGRGKSQNKK
jgi:hypothetical protein